METIKPTSFVPSGQITIDRNTFRLIMAAAKQGSEERGRPESQHISRVCCRDIYSHCERVLMGGGS